MLAAPAGLDTSPWWAPITYSPACLLFFFFFALDCPGSLLWHLGSLDAVSGLVAPSHVVSYFLNLSPRHWKVDP